MKDKLKEGDKVVIEIHKALEELKEHRKELNMSTDPIQKIQESLKYPLINYLNEVHKTYTKQDVDNAYYKGYDKGYEDGYDKAWMWDV